jgi:protein phosphatase
MHVSWAARTHPGLRRPLNEDCYCAREDLGLFLVADGMGGHAGGEVASRLAVEMIEQFVADSTQTATDATTGWPFSYDARLTRDANRLKTAFHLANRRLGAESARQLMLRGMATTASGVLIGSTSTATAGHVGDSRIYCFRAGALVRLSQDHSWVEEQVRAGVIDARTANQHPWRNVVTRALSGGDDPNVDLFDVHLQDADRLLICSDGLFVVVDDPAIGAVLAAERDLGEACERLVEAANAAGGPDNVTVLAIDIHVV